MGTGVSRGSRRQRWVSGRQPSDYSRVLIRNLGVALSPASTWPVGLELPFPRLFASCLRPGRGWGPGSRAPWGARPLQGGSRAKASSVMLQSVLEKRRRQWDRVPAARWLAGLGFPSYGRYGPRGDQGAWGCLTFSHLTDLERGLFLSSWFKDILWGTGELCFPSPLAKRPR